MRLNMEEDKKSVSTFFDVLGVNETGCTRSLAAFIAKEKPILNSLDIFSKKKIRNSSLRKMKIYAELQNGNSRNDIACISEDYYIIIEAKIGNNTVADGQILKYIEVLKSQPQENKHLIFLTQFENQTVSSEVDKTAVENKITISTSIWTDFLKCIEKRKDKFFINIADEFQNYIKRSIEMKTYDREILAVKVSKENDIELFKRGYYRQDYVYSPIFIARRETFSSPKPHSAFDKLYPVQKVLLFENSEDKKEIDEIYKKLKIEQGAEKAVYVFDFDHPIELKKPSTFQFHQNDCTSVSFSEIYKE